jgi:hypothetical protein
MRKSLTLVCVLAVVCLFFAAWAEARPGTGTTRGTSGQGLNTQGTDNSTRTPVSNFNRSKSTGSQTNAQQSQGNIRPNPRFNTRWNKEYAKNATTKSGQAYVQSVQNNWQNYWNNFSGPKPFTPAWYANHPTAWKVAHPYTQPGVVVTWASLVTWLGLPSTATPGTGDYQGYTETMIYTTEDGTTLTSIEATVYSNNADQQQQAKHAAQVASNGDTVENNAQWMPLGVFGLVANGQIQSNVTMQLNVSKNGTIRGTYYDLLSNTTQTMKGSVDKVNRRAAWSISTNPTVVFETNLNNLTNNTGWVNIYHGNKQTQKATLVQMNTVANENPNTSGVTPTVD